MRRVVDDERIMHKVCDLYYNQNFGQKEIASALGLSRPTISRLLINARDTGVVRIILTDLSGRKHLDLEQRLKKKYGLKEVIITESPSDTDALKNELGRAAAIFLERILHNGFLVGVSMGTTLSHIAPHITADYFHGITFIPMIGGVGDAAIELHSNYLCQAMAKALGGDALAFHAPAMVSRYQAKRELMQEESISRIISQGSKIDIAICGIGAPQEDSTVIHTGYFSPETLDQFQEEHICGDICLQFFDREGNASHLEHNQRVVGMDITLLRKLPWSIGLAGGGDKAEAILGAIAGGYINTLITDFACAQLI